MTQYEWCSVGLSVATLAAVGVTAVVYFLQLRAMRDQLAVLRDATLQTDRQACRNRALDLGLEFWSPIMVQHRTRLYKRISRILKAGRTPEGEIPAIPRLFGQPESDESLLLDFLVVQGFFLKVAKQARHGRLDAELCREQFNTQFARFYNKLFIPGLEGIHAADPDGWSEALSDYHYLAAWLSEREDRPNQVLEDTARKLADPQH